MRRDAGAVRSLIREGADVNAPQGDGMTALHWAGQHDDAGMAGMLISSGANVNALTRIGQYTPLHLASQVGSASVVKALLEAGSDPEAFTTTGVTPLHFAAAAGSAEAVAVLLDHGTDVNARESAWGQTPLMFAAAKGRVSTVETLLSSGADVGAHSRVVDVLTRLQEDRADRQRRSERMRPAEAPRPTNARPPRQEPARAAQGTGQAYGAGARPPEEPEPLTYADLVGGQGGLTALLHAAREGHTEAALALLDGGADIDQISAGDDTSPMLIAMINGHFDLALQLLERGADPTLTSHAGTTPLYAALNVHWAPKSRYPQQHAYAQQRATYLDVMDTLLKAGADPNARLTKHLWYMSYNFDLLHVDTKGATPFWRAAYATDVDAMRLLVAHGAEAGIATERTPGRSRARQREDLSGLPPVPVGGPAVYPIHAASGVGYGEGYAGNSHRHVPDGWLPAVKYMVEELEADVNARDLNGYTPLHHAAARADNELILYLVERGADVTAVSRRGQTTADMANGPYQRTQPYPETVALLEELGSANNHNCVSCE